MIHKSGAAEEAGSSQSLGGPSMTKGRKEAKKKGQEGAPELPVAPRQLLANFLFS